MTDSLCYVPCRIQKRKKNACDPIFLAFWLLHIRPESYRRAQSEKDLRTIVVAGKRFGMSAS